MRKMGKSNILGLLTLCMNIYKMTNDNFNKQINCELDMYYIISIF